MSDPFKPSKQVLVALASLAAHIDEMMTAGGHPFDKYAVITCLNSPGVRDWMDKMAELGFLPVKRK